jgi:cytochrome P450
MLTCCLSSGSDTTATALSSTIFYLARNPEAYTRVVNEVRRFFKNASDVCLGQTLNSCVYLRACVNESMRLSPPIGSALWRELTDGGCSIGGIHLRAGVEVGTCIYSIHHRSDYYPDQFAYKPDRWVVSEATGVSRKDVDLALSAYTPFSLEPRSCLGKSLAVSELMLTIAVILCAFDFRTPEGAVGRLGEGTAGAEFERHVRVSTN